MDPLDAYVPPPAYEQEYEQKTSRAMELSLELAKSQTLKFDFDLDEEGFPPYDPAMFEETPTPQKEKDPPTTITIRSSSIGKRRLPNPSSSASATDAGPSTLRQTAPLHISKKSISKPEEVAQDTEIIDITPEDIPPYTSRDISVSTLSPPQQSIDIPEDNPPYVALDLSNSPSLQSIPHDAINLANDDPLYVASTSSLQNTTLDTYAARNTSLPSLQNQRVEDMLENNHPSELDYAAEPPYSEQPARNWEEDNTTLTHGVTSGMVLDNPIDHLQSTEPELTERSIQGRDSLNPDTFDMQSRYSIAPNLPVLHGQQHLSLPPVPRSLPRILTPERPRSQIMIPSPTVSRPTNSPRVVFNPNVAYGKPAVGGSQFRPRAQIPQTPFQAVYNPHMLYK